MAIARDDGGIINAGNPIVKNNSNQYALNVADNYIYLYHIDTFIIVPGYADSVTDSLSVNYSSSTPLARSAPIYSYQNSGPRQVQVSFNLHRDMMTQLNTGISNAKLGLSNGVIQQPGDSEYSNDYVDFMINAIQAAALPSYDASQKLVNPPIIAVKLGSDIFIKGVITGSVNITYKYPILRNGKYSNVDISFAVVEVDPYDAETVVQAGSFRGLNTSLERRIYSAVQNKGETAYI